MFSSLKERTNNKAYVIKVSLNTHWLISHYLRKCTFYTKQRQTKSHVQSIRIMQAHTYTYTHTWHHVKMLSHVHQLTCELSVCARSFRAGSLVEVLATLSFNLSKKSWGTKKKKGERIMGNFILTLDSYGFASKDLKQACSIAAT